MMLGYGSGFSNIGVAGFIVFWRGVPARTVDAKINGMSKSSFIYLAQMDL